MHATDKAKAIKYLRSIAAVAIQTAEILEGTRESSLVLASDDNVLAEAHSVIGGDLDKIEGLGIWTDSEAR